MKGLSAWLRILGCALLASACASTPAAKETTEVAKRRLQGAWTLLDFKPEAPLEPMLQSLLALQFGTMAVAIDQNQLLATGPGVRVQRRYEITEAAFDNVRIVLIDEQGIRYRGTGQFRGNDFEFASHDSPWRGRGTLRRR